MRRFPRAAALLALVAVAGGALWAIRRGDDAGQVLERSRSLAAAGRKAEAFDLCARAADAAPDDPVLWAAAADAAYAAHGLAAGDAVAADFLLRHPDSDALRRVRGGLYEREGLAALEQGRPAAAFAQLRVAARIAPNLPTPRRVLGEMLADHGFHRAATAHLEAAVAADPGDARAWHRLGRLRSENDLKGSVDAFENAARLAADNALVRVDLASVLRTANRLEDAEARLREAVAIAPGDPVVLAAAGAFLASTGSGKARRDEAEALLARAIAAGAETGDVHAVRAGLALERGDPKAALGHARRAVAAPLDDAPAAWYTFSRAAFAAGDRATGARALARSTALRQARLDRGRAVELAFRDPSNPQKRLAVARVFAADGDFVKAVSQYRGALALAPGNAAARRELDALLARLEREKRMPQMELYEAMVAADREGT